MKTFSQHLTSPLEDLPKINFPESETDLVFIHGTPFSLEDPHLLENFRVKFPNAAILGCSSAGEVVNGNVYDNSIIFSALNFEHSWVRSARLPIAEDNGDSFQKGVELANQLESDDLRLIVLFCEGLGTDCDRFIDGLKDGLNREIPVSGGLAGDCLLFDHTIVLDRNGVYDDGVVAVGLYGDSLNVRLATSPFEGMPRVDIEITKSEGNLVQEINGKSALAEYARLIGDSASQLPGICLNFPIIIFDPETNVPICCRTMHEVIEEEQTILAAGSIPEGPATIIDCRDKDKVFEDAKKAIATATFEQQTDFAFVVNCAGRRAALGDAWSEEMAIICQNLGDIPHLGFYSYGEIGDSWQESTIVHNQSVNLFTLHET